MQTLFGKFLRSCASVTLLVASSSALADSIELVGGQRYDDITNVTAKWNSVEFRVRRQKKRVSSDEVVSLRRDSTLLRRVRAAQIAGDYEGALAVLEGIEVSGAAKWETAEVAYLKGTLELAIEEYEEAVTSLEAYLEAHKKSKDWWVPFAVHDLGTALLARRQASAAGVYFKSLVDFGPAWELRGKLGQARSLLAAKGKRGAQSARTLAREVYDVAEPRALKEESLLLQAEAWIVADGPERAITDLRPLFFDSPRKLTYSAARARATLLVAQAHAALAKRGRGEEQRHLENAEVWALRVATLYRHYGDVYVEACESLVKVYEGLGKEDLAAAWRERAKAL